LEELNIPFELKVYLRNKQFRAPKELENVHPLGKSPVIEVIDTKTGESEVIAETGHIFNYILSNYDTTNILTPVNRKLQNQVDYFLHYAEGTLQPNLVALLVHGFAKQQAPFGTKFLMGLLVNGIDSMFYIPELKKNLNYLEDIMRKQHENGSNYFVGDKLSGADIILEFPVITNIFQNKRGAEQLGAGDVEKEYPHLNQWAEDIKKEPKYIKAQELVAKHETVKPNI
ncbi:glutathione S-transferase, partial [Candida albicans P87]